jgi:FkbM family methyltransferase
MSGGSTNGMTETEYVEVRFAGWGATFRDFDKDDHILRQMRSSHEFYESDLLGWMFHNNKPGGYVIDVGACIGTFTVFCAKILKAEVFAIEPDEQNYQELDFNIHRNSIADKVTLLRAAIGARNGSGMIRREVEHNCGAKAVVSTSLSEHVSLDQVEVTTLDATAADRRISCIKIDTEGAEVSVLKGAAEVIRRWRPVIIVECANDGNYSQLETYLEALGYGFHRRFCVTPTYVFVPRNFSAIKYLLYKLMAPLK